VSASLAVRLCRPRFAFTNDLEMKSGANTQARHDGCRMHASPEWPSVSP
jgi:hypothetical protein